MTASERSAGVAIEFPAYSGVRCLMMPYVQGAPDSVPDDYAAYRDIISSVFLRRGERGFLTIDESPVIAGQPHRGARAKYGRALHTEAGLVGPMYAWGGGYSWGGLPSPTVPVWGGRSYGWGSEPRPEYGWGGGPTWGGRRAVTLDRDVRILLASNIDDTTAVWNAEHEDTSEDGDIGHVADLYPYAAADFLKAGEVREIGILTPHESLPVKHNALRSFLRIVGSGVHGREPYFTVNPLETDHV